ncbi:alpha/beta fold hydrolase [Vulcanisaeta thermophila]|uniref:alpha/beta fold hydrolase n=1 Tax=Vulcanisaeta thermophila TaxID=867917 RepID=UPI0008535EC7|nr:alpha/beta hydrolase [Vulcanisaeta thermophila]
MPYIHSIDAKIYYERIGNGPALVLIEGLGYSSWMWIMQKEDLSRDHELIIYDNRGVGKSDKPNYPYTMDLLVEDLRNLIDALGLDKVHVLGVSMGGMVAQLFAIKYPSRVKSLILVSTHHGGKDVEPPPKETLEAMFGEPPPNIKNDVELYRYKMSYAFSTTWLQNNKDVLDYLISLRLREPQPKEAYLNQAHAALTFDVSNQLSQVRVPTLVVHGDEDKVVPITNACMLFRKIETASLVIFKGAGHLLIIERARDFNNLVRGFIRDVETNNYKPRRIIVL